MRWLCIAGGIVLSASLGCGGGGGGGGGAASPLSFPDSNYLNVFSTFPAEGETAAGLSAPLQVIFDKPVDAATLSGNLRVEKNGQAISGSISLEADGRTVTFVPNSPLLPGTTYQFHVTPGAKTPEGVPLFNEHLGPFVTAPAFQASLFPFHGAAFVARNYSFAVWFTRPVDPNSVGASTVWVEKNGVLVPGSLSLGLGNRVVRFQPASPLDASSVYSFRVAGGSSGVLSANGEALAANSLATFTTAQGNDINAPKLTVTVQEIPSTMNADLTIPSSGARIDLLYSDTAFGFVDPSTLSLIADVDLGPGAPAGTNLIEALPIFLYDTGKIRIQIPKTVSIAAPTVTFTGNGADLAGNIGNPSYFSVSVLSPDGTTRAFEKIQLCWARFDLDRNQDGAQDFWKDLLVYGLVSAEDPIGKNAYLRELIEQGVIESANGLFQTSSWGRVLVKRSQPDSVLFMKIAVGGLDPASAETAYTGLSTGVLGRAIYDELNANWVEDDTALVPPLGVFVGEMFRAYHPGSGYVDSTFAATFSPISEDLGGIPVGEHAEDSAILDPAFQYALGTAGQKQRYNSVFTAINRFNKVTGFLLAHEVAHSLGLVPNWLFGANYHNAQGSPSDVMLPSVSFSNVVNSNVKFRPLDLSYLFELILKG